MELNHNTILLQTSEISKLLEGWPLLAVSIIISGFIIRALWTTNQKERDRYEALLKEEREVANELVKESLVVMTKLEERLKGEGRILEEVKMLHAKFDQFSKNIKNA